MEKVKKETKTKKIYKITEIKTGSKVIMGTCCFVNTYKTQ